MASTKTSPKKNSNKGFTLLEIIISLAIIGGTMAILVPQLLRRSDGAGVKKAAHHLYVVTKDIRTQARLKNRTFRLVFNMDGKEHGYWVESAAGLVVPKTEADLEKERNLKDDEKPASQFQKEEKFTKKEYTLPKGFFIGQIETQSRKEPVVSGHAYVYFSPQGLVEPAVIQITNRSNITWSIVVNSLTGQSDIVDKAYTLREARNP